MRTIALIAFTFFFSASVFESQAQTDCHDVEYQGHTYSCVQIKDQCWFAENLRVESYANGDSIPSDLTGSEWTSTREGALTHYNLDAENLDIYGRLYNWFAVSDARGLCPTGWHVPTEADWQELVDSFLRGTTAGQGLKASEKDDPAWNGNNRSGFSGLPGGWRYSAVGNYGMEGSKGYWWSTTPAPKGRARFMSLSTDKKDVLINSGYHRLGYSVRCLRD